MLYAYETAWANVDKINSSFSNYIAASNEAVPLYKEKERERDKKAIVMLWLGPLGKDEKLLRSTKTHNYLTHSCWMEDE